MDKNRAPEKKVDELAMRIYEAFEAVAADAFVGSYCFDGSGRTTLDGSFDLKAVARMVLEKRN